MRQCALSSLTVWTEVLSSPCKFNSSCNFCSFFYRHEFECRVTKTRHPSLPATLQFFTIILVAMYSTVFSTAPIAQGDGISASPPSVCVPTVCVRLCVSVSTTALSKNPVKRSKRSGLDQLCVPLKLTSPNSRAVRMPALAPLSLSTHHQSQIWATPVGQHGPANLTHQRFGQLLFGRDLLLRVCESLTKIWKVNFRVWSICLGWMWKMVLNVQYLPARTPAVYWRLSFVCDTHAYCTSTVQYVLDDTLTSNTPIL